VRLIKIITNPLQAFEDLHNWASDFDAVWFPFLMLKPKPEVFITLPLRLKMSPCFGLYFGLFNVLRLWIIDGTLEWPKFFLTTLKFTVFFFFWFQFVTAFFWNRRARRLQAAS